MGGALGMGRALGRGGAGRVSKNSSMLQSSTASPHTCPTPLMSAPSSAMSKALRGDSCHQFTDMHTHFTSPHSWFIVLPLVAVTATDTYIHNYHTVLGMICIGTYVLYIKAQFRLDYIPYSLKRRQLVAHVWRDAHH